MITWQLDEENSNDAWRMWTGHDEHGMLWTIDRFHRVGSEEHELHLYRFDSSGTSTLSPYQERILSLIELKPAEADQLELRWKIDLEAVLMELVL